MFLTDLILTDVILTDLNKIQNSYHPTIIMGDINVDNLTKQQKKTSECDQNVTSSYNINLTTKTIVLRRGKSLFRPSL